MFGFRKKSKKIATDVDVMSKLHPSEGAQTSQPAPESVDITTPPPETGQSLTPPPADDMNVSPVPTGATRPNRKKRRPAPNKTRLMGFDTSDGTQELFDEKSAGIATGRCIYPVGFALITKGPGLGECFALQAGMSQIGRGEDQAVCLDFGDMAISRSNHAAIVYDPAKHTFLLGHGGKANLVRLNSTPVVSTSDLKDGDEIEIGETTLRFVGVCSESFNWAEAQSENEGSDDDVEIA